MVSDGILIKLSLYVEVDVVATVAIEFLMDQTAALIPYLQL